LARSFFEARVVAQGVAMGIVFDPVTLSPAFRKYTLEKIQSFLLETGFGAQAGGVDECAEVVGVEFERARVRRVD
jgi:hypothetical protein